MGLLDQILIEVSLKAFQQAVSRNKVYGRLGSDKRICVKVLLGSEVQDTSHHQDQTTEYRKFVNCTIEFAETFDQLKAGQSIKGATVFETTIWLFPKTTLNP
jgi:hypothetical protein